MHYNGPSVTRISPRFVRLYVRFTRMANVLCARQALAGTGVWKISSVACGFISLIKIDYSDSDYLKSLIRRINEAIFYLKKKHNCQL